MRLKHAASAALLLAAAACTGDASNPLTPKAPDGGPSAVISDAAHAGAVPGFYFLPPAVPAPSYSGTFDAALSPRVEICELSGPACGTVIATFTSGTGSGNVRVSAADQHYIVNWHAGDYNLDVNKTYRISVYSGTFLLGFADVDVVSSGKELKNVNTQQFIPLQDNRTLPIKFRIETGIVGQVAVSPAVDSINVGETTQFTATCTNLHGNPVSCPTVTWSSSNPAVATISSTGLATGVAPGTVTITASIGYASGTAQLTVVQPNTPPVGVDDSFDAIGNVTVPVAAPGVLANDTDADGNTLSAVAGTFATTGGGTVTIAADGSFSYLSAPGFIGNDTFQYTVTDGIDNATATVIMETPTRVWYVSNLASGDGRDASPFATLAEAEAASAAGETIFLLFGNGTSAGYDAGITLKAGQALTGQGVPSDVTVSLNGQTVVLLAAGSAPTVTRASGSTIQLASNNTVQGLNVTSGAGAGIAGNGFGTFAASFVSVSASGGPAVDLQNGTAAAAFDVLSSSNSTSDGLRLVNVGGTFSAASGSISGAASAGVSVSSGNGTVSYGGTVSAAAGRSASITGRTGGTVTLSGDINDSGDGALVQNNLGGTIAFTGGSKVFATGASNGVTLASNAGATVQFGGGGLQIATTTGTGFSATGGGTFTVTGLGNSVGTSGGTAVRVVNTTLGAGGATFQSVSASGGANGIVLDNTGTGGFQVTGTGAAGSGGTIQNLSGADGGTDGIGVYLANTANVSLSSMQLNDFSNFAIRGVNVSGVSLAGTVVSGVNGSSAVGEEGSIAFDGLTGSASITGSSVSGGLTDNLRVVNASGVLNRLTISGTTIGANSTLSGDEGLALVATGTAVLNVTVQSSFFTSARSNLLQVDLQGSAASDLVLSGNAFSDNHPAIASGGGNVSIDGTGSAALTFQISGNTFRDAVGGALIVSKSGTGTYSGTIDGNVIGVSGVANSGSKQGSGLTLINSGGGTFTAAVTGNQVRQYNNQGILLQVGDAAAGGNGTLNATVTGNTVAQPGTVVAAKNGINLNAGTITGDAHQVCLALSGNTLTGSGSGGAAGTDIRLRQRMLTTVRLPGYAGANSDNLAVQAFTIANNGGTPTSLAQNNVAGGGGGFVGGAGCPQP